MKYTFNWKLFKKHFKRDWQLHLLVLFPVIYLVIFDFIPMYGYEMSFRDFRPALGIIGSEWVGLKWFEKFLGYHEFTRVFLNTIRISLWSFSTFPAPIIYALILHAMKSEKYTKVVQTISYMPHFISTVIMVGIIHMVLSPTSGFYASMYKLFGGEGYPQDIRFVSQTFIPLYILSGLWQGLGWSSIIYVAALSSVSQELHEAAEIDGANRFKRMIHIDIPAITPTICILFLMSCCSIIGVGFEKVYLMQSAFNLSTTEVISTYVYKTGLKSLRSYSYGTAVGLFNTAINMAILVVVNAIVSKATDGEIALY